MTVAGLLISTWNPAVVARLDRAGQIVWDTYVDWAQVGGLVSFDTGVLAVGYVGHDLWIGEIDLSGNEVQDHQWDFGNYIEVTGVLPIEGGATPSFRIRGILTGSDYWFRAVLAYVTYDPAATGDPLTFHWCRQYDSQSTYGPNPDTFTALLWDDGDIYVSGVTSAGQPEGTIDTNALLMKLDEDGDQVWARAMIDGGQSITAIAFDGDGDLVTAGTWGQGLVEQPYYHACWIGQFSALDGTYTSGTTLLEDLWWEAHPDTSAYPSYTTPGASIYDVPSAIVPLADGGYAVTGYSGLWYRIGWIMSLDSGLAVRWLSTLDGDGEDLPAFIADQGDGLAVLGATSSPAVYGYGGGAWDTMAVKVPYDGIVLFDPATGMSTRYTKPDMVPPPDDEGYQVDLTYAITDLYPVHETGTVRMYAAGVSSWTLDPW